MPCSTVELVLATLARAARAQVGFVSVGVSVIGTVRLSNGTAYMIFKDMPRCSHLTAAERLY